MYAFRNLPNFGVTEEYAAQPTSENMLSGALPTLAKSGPHRPSNFAQNFMNFQDIVQTVPSISLPY